jgi:predicted AlkP superfamily pyrophosphatase or phosphodiesterase
VLLAGAAPAGSQGGGRGQAAPAPRLAIVIVVDQMRADYVDRFRGDWTGGLRRLLRDGAWFRNAAFPYLTTVTCPGHATISTGAFPHRHGVFQNAWFDRTARRSITCTDDANATGIRYPDGRGPGASAARLLVPGFADELRARHVGARVATISLKARSAIMLAGHGGDAVTWLAESADHWETSSAFAPGPVPAVKAFLDANPIDADFGKTWTRRLPAQRYPGPDAGPGEAPPRGWTASFPHVLDGDDDDEPDRDFREQWTRSPFADAYLGRFAAALVDALELGTDDRPDFLGVSFSSPDLVGHPFGPDSHEVQDIYAHLDRTIGALLEHLDEVVGRDRYVVALASDHGVSAIPEQTAARGGHAGRLSTTRLADVAERAARAAAGAGTFIARVSGNDVYFEPGAYDKLAAAPAALEAVMEALADQPGVARVFRREQLIDADAARDRLLRAAALSYVPQLSGDLVMALDPGWMYTQSGTTHGSANPDDQRVPVIFMGPGVRRGSYRDAATPADVAPTLAALFDVTMPRAEGRALRMALSR